MKNLFNSLFSTNRKIPAEYKDAFADRLANDNAQRMSSFALYIIIVQIALQIVNALKPEMEYDSTGTVVTIPLFVYIALSLGQLAVGIVFRLLFFIGKKGKFRTRLSKNILTSALLYIYVLITLAFNCLNILTNSGIFSYLTLIVILGIMPIIRPKQSFISIWLCFIGSAIFTYITGMPGSPLYNGTWQNLVTTDRWTSTIIITGFVSFASVLMFNYYRNSFIGERELAKANEEVYKLAITDQMTGLLNRNALYTKLDEFWYNAIEGQYQIAVAMIDIDFFKSYNDTFGHLEGDNVIKSVAGTIKGTFRRSYDIVARFGGEEFIVVYKSEAKGASEIAEMLRNNIEALNVASARKDVSDHLTISIGVCALMPAADIKPDKILKLADDALYHSKESGRNRVTLWHYGDIVNAELAAEIKKENEKSDEDAHLSIGANAVFA
jgi:diguanylate cyclase (GGDEF)-like protein